MQGVESSGDAWQWLWYQNQIKEKKEKKVCISDEKVLREGDSSSISPRAREEIETEEENEKINEVEWKK